VRGTDGDARIYKYGGREIPCLFKAGKLTDNEFDFLIMDVGYLSGPPLHIHREQHDTFYVLEGVLSIQVGEDITELHPGDFATVPPGVPHTFDNIQSGQVVKVANLMTPSGFDAYFAEVAELETDGNNTTEALEHLAAKYGTTVVGSAINAKLGLT
jgi:quercetin dioxygenase-like cupin family protein